MRRRCNDIKHEHYDYYGGRGIEVCEDWSDFKNFYDWSINNGYKPGLTIDREDGNGNYCPENCRWVDNITQANNKSNNNIVTYNDVTKTVAQWARLFGVQYETLRKRIQRGDMRDFEYYFNKE